MSKEYKKKRKWYDFTLWLFVIHALLAFAYIELDFVKNITFNMYINFLVFNLVPSIFLGFVVYSKYGANDFRFKLLFYILMIITAPTLTIFLMGQEGIFLAALPTAELAPLFAITLFFAVIIVIGSLFSIIDLTTKFGSELAILADRVKSKEFTAQITSSDIQSDGIFAPMAKFVNEMVLTTGQLINELSDTSSIIAATAEELSSSAEEVNASSEEVSNTSQSMAHGAVQQSELISNIVTRMQEADEVIDDIISRIQKNTQTVSQIALQTNILALNAGIEASRAGDYGRGFAVVAENVRKLSDESKNSSDEIGTVVQTISVTLKDVFNQMQESINNVAAVSEETAASSEQVAAAAEEMASSMEQVTDLSVDLSERAAKLTEIAN